MNLFSKIMVPAVAVVGMTLAGNPGYDKGKTPHGVISLYSTVVDTTGRDSLANIFDDDQASFGVVQGPSIDDSMRIDARDTMKVPDSLRLINPFLFKWYVAVKDSFVHKKVCDSLLVAGDTITSHTIDSLYFADSTLIAKAKFDAWWAGLSKAERKKWKEEQELPIIRRRMDSISRRKDSIKLARDSARSAVPRVLDTYAVSDSLHFKRMISWTHNRYFNVVEPLEIDTTYNYHFYDYPYLREDVGGSFLGVAGSAVQTYDFFKRRGKGRSISWYAPYESWTYSPDDIPLYNTKSPHTELEYYGTLFATSTKESDNIRIFTTQNIFPQLNLTLEYKRYGGGGILENESVNNRTAAVTTNWLGKRYVMHAGYIHNRVVKKENGGIVDNFWITDTTVEAREISVHLKNAANTYKKDSYFLDQSYMMPFTFLKLDSTAAGFIGHSSEYTKYSKVYTDQFSKSDLNACSFYNNNFFINPSSSKDSVSVSKIENRVYARLQPWKDDAIISKVEGGLGNRILSHYMFQPNGFVYKPKNQVWNSSYVYAGAEGKLKGYMNWDVLGSYTFLGEQANDMSLEANLGVNLYPFRRKFKRSPLKLGASFATLLEEPDYFQQEFYSNHTAWKGDFNKISTTKLEGFVDIPRWDFRAEAGYSLLSGNIYYDEFGIAQQNNSPMSVFKLFLKKNLTFGPAHLENRLLMQKSSNEDVMPLPLIAGALRWYVQFNVVSADVMKMQLGADVRFTSKWYAPGFNPETGVFFNQKEEMYGNCPVADVFMNLQWKTACIFVKYENMNMGWPMNRTDYFSAHNYIHTTKAIKIGIWWPFDVGHGKNSSMSDRAGSGGMGGGLGGGMSGATGGLKSGLSNLSGGGNTRY